ncbi:periplasmic binding protein-like II [Anaeromyces robustus]|uniref:Periplasmic binding protein-like II n=1 Tax=Anaeromyces robustus TaxID=1754192 RepID=A0A1Y1X0H9_9FUNG|nr:periplasmic binding protein-like II [Anaeromyces robustus]|eukprot:ORX79253.1 periplasmic binding protein-like II [Anaeromyces robustus]
MNYILLLFLILSIINLNGVKAVTVNAITFSFAEKAYIYPILMNAFNDYSKKEELGIDLKITVFTPENSTSLYNEYGATVGTLLSKKSTKYDMYFYYSAYVSDYGPHLLNLDEWLPKEHIENHDSGILSSSCTYNGHTVGLPISLDVDAFYSNIALLTSYNKTVPETWDELIETSKYILEKEREKNNTSLIGYNGLMNVSHGSLSIYEYINTFRKTPESPHPSLKSQETTDALKKLKEIMNEVSSASIFDSPDEYTVGNLYSNNAIFLKFWYIPTPFFKVSSFPGWKKGILGSFSIPYNFAISRYIDDNQKKAAVKVLEFMTSESTQKNVIIKNSLFSAIDKLYDDPEVCQLTNCEFVKSVQPFTAIDYTSPEFNERYLERYQHYVFEYLYDNKPLSEAIKLIEDMTKEYYLSIIPDDSSIGLIIFIIVIIISLIMTSSLSLLDMKKFKSRYEYLSKSEWMVTILGCLILIGSVFTLYGIPNNVLCHFRIILNSLGFIVSLIPTLYKLIIKIPENNGLTKWAVIHRWEFYFITFIIPVVLYGLKFIVPYTTDDITIKEGENFKICSMDSTLGNLFTYFIIFYDVLIILMMLLLIFIEWSLEESYITIRLLLSAMLINTMFLIIYSILLKIKIRNYYTYHIIHIGIIIGFAVSNYLLIYLINGFFAFVKPKEEDILNTSFNKRAQMNTTKVSVLSTATANSRFSRTSKNSKMSQLSSISEKILYCHYKKTNNMDTSQAHIEIIHSSNHTYSNQPNIMKESGNNIIGLFQREFSEESHNLNELAKESYAVHSPIPEEPK